MEVLFNTRLQHFSVGQDLPFHVITRQITEEILVINTNLKLFIGLFHITGPDRLINMTDLIHVRIGYTVGTNQTVVTEVIVGCIVSIEVSSVGIYFFAFFVLPTD
ncbi:hypothetical protein SDC9_80302 [bioreactor metagenome]|uniref:Uncharacterized protein n=1 Tax=bioreactor metagenome TaxID=1076179 RepID=A0A644Z6K9_9ZZZZ